MADVAEKSRTRLALEQMARNGRYRIPDHMWGAVERYVEHRIPPGNFLSAVVSNDLREAASRADDDNQRALADYMAFFTSYAPMGCWGSPEAYHDWINPKETADG
ncbi:MAG: hypothetical protein AAGJ50_03580 [Pseudomonadota bacterium]